jgi:hypothetical protein
MILKLFFPGIGNVFSPELSAFIALPFHLIKISESSTKRLILSILNSKYFEG